MSNVICPRCGRNYLHGHPDNPECNKCGFINKKQSNVICKVCGITWNDDDIARDCCENCLKEEKEKTMEDEEGTYGDIVDLFNKCETESDFKKFYLDYWKIVEKAINKENNISYGNKRRFDLIYDRVRSNLMHLLGDGNEMRIKYAQKVWWFLI